jgi:hypothetical protein
MASLFVSVLALALISTSVSAADWKLTGEMATEYKRIDTTEKAIVEKWLITLPDRDYKESFRQLLMGLVLWSYREPTVFLDYEFLKLFETTGKVVNLYAFAAGDAGISLDIYSPPVIPGDL